jgi:hypothetical protein
VVDGYVGYCLGINIVPHINSEAIKLAIVNAARDKVAFYARYAITIAPENWSSCLPAGYRADNGDSGFDNCGQISSKNR